ncbi:MAG: hypothetical protein LBB59_07935 [Campylobacteraceae bacterium]|jgi:hypothetical protein|nr:hypothetical protein [Campylobacteraceae bacterium]
MYCANAFKYLSTGHAYNNTFIVISSSTLQELFDLAANKRINIEEYADSDKSVYWSIVNELDNAVWSVPTTTA